MSLKTKLILLFIAFTFIPVVILGGFIFSRAGTILKSIRLAQLNNIVDLKKDKIESFFNERKGGMKEARSFRTVQENLPALIAHWHDLKHSAYVKAKTDVDERISILRESYGYLDIMLTDRQGNIVYVNNPRHISVDLGHKLVDWEYSQKSSEDIHFTNVFLNKDLGNTYEMISTSAVKDRNGALIGEVAFEIDMGPIYRFIQDNTGLGQSGEALIVKHDGNDVLFLSPLRGVSDAALKKRIPFDSTTAYAAQMAASGENGSGLAIDYRQEKVFAAWRYIPSLRWGLVAKIDAAEALAPIRDLKVLILTVELCMLFIGVAAALVLAGAITGPLTSLEKSAEAIAAGDLRQSPATGRNDEVGRLSHAIDTMTRALIRDIAEREQTGKRLRESLETSQAILNAAAEPVFLMDTSGTIEAANDTMSRRYDKKVQDIIGISLYDLLPPEVAKPSREHYEEAIRSKKPLIFEDVHHGIYMEHSIYPILDAHGEVVRFAVYSRDVTDRIKTEVIRLANSYNRRLLETSLDPLVTIDADGKITDVNAATETVTGRLREQLIGTDFSDYFTDPSQARNGYQRAFIEGSVKDFALQIRHRDGHVTPVLYNAAVYRDDDGNVLGLFAAARDITELKKAEEKLRDSEARFRLMVESIQDYAIIMLDPEGRIVNWNIGAERIKGYTPQEIIGKHFSCFYTTEDKASGKPDRELEQAIANGKSEEEGLRVKKDGSIFLANVILTALRDDSGILKGFSKITQDITERKKAEEQIKQLNRELEQRVLERTAQLEAANKELEAFAYSVSHDLRSPLRSIDGFSLALLEDCADRLDVQGKDFLTRIRNATQRMARLIDDLLKLSRVTRSEMTHETVNLSGIVQTISDHIRKQDPGRAADFIIAGDLKVSGDAHLLTIAIENLLVNAWKFTKKSPRTVIEFGVVHRSEETVYFIRDNGAGFDMAFAGKLFNPFQRLHRESEFPGTGIGLATVKRIISRHGGRVWIEGEENRGTTVYFTL